MHQTTQPRRLGRPVSLMGVAALILSSTAMSVAASPAPTGSAARRLVADRATYAPDATARLSGIGYAPGSVVTLRVRLADGTSPLDNPAFAPWTATVDANGRFQTTWRVCGGDCANTLLRAEVVGPGTTASTTFMDDPNALPPPRLATSACQRHVLLLSDIDNVGTTALADALIAAGHDVTVRPAPEYTWDGTNPPLTGFDAVVHLNGATPFVPLPVSGQQTLEAFVFGGGIFVGSQWNGFERHEGQQVDMNDLVLQSWADGGDNCTCPDMWNVTPGQEQHPVLTGIPASFTFYADGLDSSIPYVFNVNPSVELMRSASGKPTVLVRDFGAGHVVSFASAANFEGDQTLQDANIQRLYINGVGWGACIANQSPDCSAATASEPTLWPANHKYHAESILGVTDPDGDPVTITVTSITQDETVNGRGDGNTCPDAQIVGGQASVRAERSGQGNGRVYAINFTADDGKGGTCNGTVHVCVPHDQGGGAACVDDGQRYSSLGPCGHAGGLAAETVASNRLNVGAVTSTEARLEFALAADAHVLISVFDVSGRRLATVENADLTAGTYQRSWNMTGVSNGVYFVRLQAGDATLTRTVLKAR